MVDLVDSGIEVLAVKRSVAEKEEEVFCDRFLFTHTYRSHDLARMGEGCGSAAYACTNRRR